MTVSLIFIVRFMDLVEYNAYWIRKVLFTTTASSLYSFI